jgi:hypothetical protein
MGHKFHLLLYETKLFTLFYCYYIVYVYYSYYYPLGRNKILVNA